MSVDNGTAKETHTQRDRHRDGEGRRRTGKSEARPASTSVSGTRSEPGESKKEGQLELEKTDR